MSHRSSESAPMPVGVSDQTAVRRQIRGSSLLLTGRGCSILLNLATQVAIVRYLTKAEFGALAYAISVVEMASLTAALCMDKTFSRYGAIYHEQNDRDRFMGAWLLAVAVPLGIGAVLIAVVHSGQDGIAAWLQLDALTLSILLALVWLIPINAIASVTLALVTVVRGARTVFFRKHLFSPLLKLTLVVGVVACGGSPAHLVAALLLAGVGGLATDAWIAGQIIRRERLWPHMRFRTAAIPWRELFGFSLPLLSSDLAYLARGTLMVVLLGWLTTSESTASFRAVLPVVRLNELVLVNFTVMFTPLASRLFARRAMAEMGALYVRTRTWITVLSFPVFAGCVSLSRPLTVLMFGDRYADASLLLIVLASGYYIQACFGFSGRLLKVLGHVRPLVVIDIVSAAVALAVARLLIPDWDAAGAALAVTGGVTLHCLLKSVALQLYLGWTGPFTANRRPQVVAMLTAAVVVAASLLTNPGWSGGLVITGFSTGVVWCTCRRSLDVSGMFPEIARVWRPRWMNVQPGGTDQVTGPHIAYMMSRFPKITETFVLGEMVEMESLGTTVEVFPLQRERTRLVHPEAQRYVDRAYFTAWISPKIVASNLRFLLCHPALYTETLFTLLRCNWGSLRYFTGALAFFPKAVHLAEIMQRRRIQHLHAHFASHPAAVAWVIHRLTGIPYSFTAHGSDLHRDRHMLQEKAVEAAAVITISDYNRQLILEECRNVDPDVVHVIHCGVDTRTFTARSTSTPFERGESPLQIACIGTFHEVKGQRYLLDACTKLTARGVNCFCHLVGDGPDRHALGALAARQGLADRVQFHGRRNGPEVRELLKDIDVLVAPSVPTRCGRREGIPVVLMEALGSGIPVVASDLSGIPELVRDGITGLLTPPGDSRAIADALETLACDRDLRRRLAAAGSELVRRDFNVARNTAALKAVIESLQATPAAAPVVTATGAEPGRALEEACLC